MPSSVIEPLEPRQLFAGIIFHDHLLRVIGDYYPNVETVGLAPGGQSVVATLTFTDKKGPETFTKTVALSAGIHLVSLVGGNGGDAITVDQTNGSFPIKCIMFGGGGNDTITGGDEPDYITGCSGNDLLNGGDGNDTIYGNGGNDTIYGGPGNDWLNGGLGHDLLSGDDGNDTLADAYGPDTMYGGAGDNLFIGSVIGRDKTDFDPRRDRVRIVSTTTPDSTVPTWLSDIFPFLNW
jgi:Ca2+-binding RTX toxin-like protein